MHKSGNNKVMSEANKHNEIYEENPNIMSKSFCNKMEQDDPANYEEFSGDEEYSEEMDEEETEMYEAMNADTFAEFGKRASDYRKEGKFYEACQILKLIIQKGAGVFEDE